MTDKKSYSLGELLAYRDVNMEMPEEIIKISTQIKILTSTPTTELVIYRQKHKVLKKINIDALRSGIISAMNKLSPSTIDIVSDELKLVEGIACVDGIALLVDMIIKKACREKQFIEQYVKLFGKLVDINTTGETFVSVMCTKIKQLFEIYCKRGDDTEKDCIINFMKLIGYMYNQDILKNYEVNNFMAMIVTELQNNDYGIEMLVVLMKIIFVKYMTENKEYHEKLHTKFVNILEKHATVKRDKFLLQDIIDEIKKKYKS